MHPLNGADEETLRRIAPALLQVERITILLTLCLANLGPKSPVDFNDVRSLAVGDRDALLLHLRQLTFGDKIQSVVTCPKTDCRKKMDLKLTISDILVSPNQNAKEIYETVISENSTVYNVKFRLPTGADQEAVSKLGRRDPDAASKALLQCCIKEIQKNGINVRIKNNLPATVAESLSKRMAGLDPQAEILLNLTCPTCKKDFLANLDIGDYFFRELITHSKQLYHEVHVLALHYHWSEKDILNMTRSKRQIYLKLLADALNPE